jgi:hypothetical protein
VIHGFHPGYAGHGPYMGFGGGHYGGHERPGGWSPVHHPGFVGQRGQGNGGPESQGFTSICKQDEVQGNSARADRQQGVSKGKEGQDGASVGASAASGALSIGGKSFSTQPL